MDYKEILDNYRSSTTKLNKSKHDKIMDKAFEEWFVTYFCCAQGEDSPYRYEDVKEAFEEGFNAGWLLR